jgi:hypothetical protein
MVILRAEPDGRDGRDGMALAGKQSIRFKSKLRLLIPDRRAERSEITPAR